MLIIDWGKIITEILLVVIPLLIPALVAWAYSMAATAWRDFQKSKPSLSWFLEDAASIAVKAAEQMGAAGLLTEKRAWAVSYTQKYLDAHGLHNVDVAVIEGAIEAEVLDEFNKDRALKLPTPILPDPVNLITSTKQL